MGQKAHPIGNRLGIIRGWESSWYSKKDSYAQKLMEDNSIRSYIRTRTSKAGIAKIVIERTLGKIIVTIHTSKPGIIIGKGGAEVDSIKEELKKITNSTDVQINIFEIKKPELDAYIVAESIAQQIENRVNFKRAAKMTITSTMRAGAEGIKIKLSGRLGGAEIARSEEFKEGRTPLHTFRMDIDYAALFAMTVYGKIGVKVWICRGEILTRRDLDLNFASKHGGGRFDKEGKGDDRRPGGGGRRFDGNRSGGGFRDGQKPNFDGKPRTGGSGGFRGRDNNVSRSSGTGEAGGRRFTNNNNTSGRPVRRDSNDDKKA